MKFSFQSEHGFRNIARMLYDACKYIVLTGIAVPVYQYLVSEDKDHFSVNAELIVLSLIVLSSFFVLAYLSDCVADYIKEKKDKLA